MSYTKFNSLPNRKSNTVRPMDWLTRDFKKVDDLQDVKSTLTNLNYIFYGSMLTVCIMVLYQLFAWYGPYWLLVPASYIFVCYIGRIIHLYLTKDNQPNIPIETEEVKPTKRKSKLPA